MQSPTADAGQASEAATPGASVAAQHGGDRHTGSMFDTPGEGPPSPGQGSPAQHRSQEGRSNSRRGLSSTGPNLEAAAAVLASADGAAAPGPLTAPRLRVQGADIILEDASPKAADPGSSKQPAGGGVGNAAVAAAPAADDKSSHELELQLRLASRTATGASNMALASSRPTQQQLNSGAGLGDDRPRGHDAGALGPSSSAPGGVEGPVRMKYRSTLTEENVAYLNKLDQYTSSRPDAGGRSSSERIWRWLEGSGPPFDNPPPSLGVPPATKGGPANSGATRRHGEKRGSGGGLFSCFGACFGGGAGGTAVR
ncbi:hypothetical protein ABPG77_000779 [Micractinium sp. CCAP 211/92]